MCHNRRLRKLCSPIHRPITDAMFAIYVDRIPDKVADPRKSIRSVVAGRAARPYRLADHSQFTFSAELLAHAGFDCLTIDVQHGADRLRGAVACCRQSPPPLCSPGACALERARHHHEAARCRRLRDHLPHDQQARRSCCLCRRLPLPARWGFAATAQSAPCCTPATTTRSRPIAAILAIAMIETAEGEADVDAIAATPGIDALYIGPVAMGLALRAPNVIRPTR